MQHKQYMQYKQYHIPSTDHHAQYNAFTVMQWTKQWNSLHKTMKWKAQINEMQCTMQYKQRDIPSTDHPAQYNAMQWLQFTIPNNTIEYTEMHRTMRYKT